MMPKLKTENQSDELAATAESVPLKGSKRFLGFCTYKSDCWSRLRLHLLHIYL
jgi:hypothetical protein